MRLLQKIKITRLSILTLAICLTLSSCLKDNNPPPLYDWSTPNVVMFQDNGGDAAGGAGYGTTTTPYPLYNFPLAVVNPTDTAGFAAIIIFGPNGNTPTAITVNLAIDTAGLNAFNASNYTAFVAPDPSTYTFPASVTIPAGQNQVYARVVVTGAAFANPNASYAIPLMITSVSSGTVSGNFGVEINAISQQ